MVPMTSPTVTVSPSALEMDSRTPSCSASTSKLILSVSSSTSASPDRYGLALLLQPAPDRRVGDGLAELRNVYLIRHGGSPSSLIGFIYALGEEARSCVASTPSVSSSCSRSKASRTMAACSSLWYLAEPCAGLGRAGLPT